MPNGEPANFFALVEGSAGVEVRRLMLHAEAQEELSEIFFTARGEFLPNDVEQIPYDGISKPDSGEILVVDPFELPEDVIPALHEPTLFPVLDLRDEDAPRVKAVFTGTVWDDEAEVLFQAFQSDQYLLHKRFAIWWAGEMFHALDPDVNPGFNLRDELHALYRGGSLFFRNDWWVRRMLDLSEHYREATDADLQDFIDLAAVAVDEEEQFFDHADTWVRKRVAMINDRDILENHSPSQIRDRAVDLGLDIEVREEDGTKRIVVPETKSDLKTTLRFLNEDIYGGPITEERFVSTNKRRLENN